MKLPSCSPRRPVSAAALGLALALAPAAASAAAASPQAPAAKATTAHLVGCNESSRVRPTRFNLNVSAWRVRSGDYTRFSCSFTGGVPSRFSRSWTIDDNGRGWSGKVV